MRVIPYLEPMAVPAQVHAAVEQTGKHTFFGRTATLLQSVDSLGSLQRVLMRVVTVLLVRPGTHAPTVTPNCR